MKIFSKDISFPETCTNRVWQYVQRFEVLKDLTEVSKQLYIILKFSGPAMNVDFAS